MHAWVRYHLFFQDHLGIYDPAQPDAVSWGHVASPDLAHWVTMPVALWANQWVNGRDCGGQSTGSTTMVGGHPVVVYPGGCRNGIKNGSHMGMGNAYSVAVPQDPTDKLLTRWKRIGPIINNTVNDPSEAWLTPHGEWRLVGHGGGGPNGSLGDGAPMWATTDPSMLTGWCVQACLELNVVACAGMVVNNCFLRQCFFFLAAPHHQHQHQ
jgi:hypothetical protein